MFVFTFVIFLGNCLTIFGNNFSISAGRDRGHEYLSSSHSHYLPQASSGWGWTPPSHGGGGHGGSGFQSFFDIALTGLAFLSFGIFLLNLLLNALLGAGFITGTVYPTGTGTQTGTGGIITVTETGTGSAREGNFRPKRSLATFELDPVSSAEVMASVILQSIDAMANKHECVKKVFCDGNKDAKSIGHGFQYVFPAYSFGASYIGQKIGLHNCFENHIEAILDGMQNSNCQTRFPEC